MTAKLLVRLGLAAALFGAVGVGATIAQTQEPPANSVALAREIIVLKGGNVVFERIVPGIIEHVKNTFVPTNPQLSQPLNEVADMLHKELDPKRGEIVTEAAKVFAQHFTEQELKDIAAFYRSPVGKKLATEEPISIDESMKRAQTWADDLADKVMTRFRVEMKKKGYDL
jgi:uncharacterized protein